MATKVYQKVERKKGKTFPFAAVVLHKSFQ